MNIYFKIYIYLQLISINFAKIDLFLHCIIVSSHAWKKTARIAQKLHKYLLLLVTIYLWITFSFILREKNNDLILGEIVSVTRKSILNEILVYFWVIRHSCTPSSKNSLPYHNWFQLSCFSLLVMSVSTSSTSCTWGCEWTSIIKLCCSNFIIVIKW